MHPKNEVQIEEYFSLSKNYNCRILILDEFDKETTINKYEFDCPASVNIKKLKISDEIKYLLLMKLDEENAHVCCRALFSEDIEERLFGIGQGLVKLASKTKGVKNVKDVIVQLEGDFNWKQHDILVGIVEKIEETQIQVISSPNVIIDAPFFGAESRLSKDEYSGVNLSDYTSIPRSIDIADYFELKEKLESESFSPSKVAKEESAPSTNKKLIVDIKLVSPKLGNTSGYLVYSSIKIPPFIPKIKDLNLKNPAYKATFDPSAPLVIPPNLQIKIPKKPLNLDFQDYSQGISKLNESPKLVSRANTKIDKDRIILLDEAEKKLKIDNYVKKTSSNTFKPLARAQPTHYQVKENEGFSEFAGNDFIKNKGFDNEYEGKIHLKVENKIQFTEGNHFELIEQKKPLMSSPVNPVVNLEKVNQSVPFKIEKNSLKAHENIPQKVDESFKDSAEHTFLKEDENKEKNHSKNYQSIPNPLPIPIPKEFFTIPPVNFTNPVVNIENRQSAKNYFFNPNLPPPPLQKCDENPISLDIYFENFSSPPQTSHNLNNHQSIESGVPTNFNNVPPPPSPLLNQNLPITSSVPFQPNNIPFPSNANFNIKNPIPASNNTIQAPLPLNTDLLDFGALPPYEYKLPPPPLDTNLLMGPKNSIPFPQPSNTNLPFPSSVPAYPNSTPPLTTDLLILNTELLDLNSLPPFPLELNTSVNHLPSNQITVLSPPSLYTNTPIKNLEPPNQNSLIPNLPLNTNPAVFNSEPSKINLIPGLPLKPNTFADQIPSNKNSILPSPLANPKFPINPEPIFVPHQSSIKTFKNGENFNLIPKSPEEFVDLLEDLPVPKSINPMNIVTNKMLPPYPKATENKSPESFISIIESKNLNLPRPLESVTPPTKLSGSTAEDLFKKKDKGTEKTSAKDPFFNIKPDEKEKFNPTNLPKYPDFPSSNLMDKNFPVKKELSSDPKFKNSYKPISMHPDLPPWPANELLISPIKKVNLLPEIPKNYQAVHPKPEQKSLYQITPEKPGRLTLPSLPNDDLSSSDSESSMSSSSSTSNKIIKRPSFEEIKKNASFQEKDPEIIVNDRAMLKTSEDIPEIILSQNQKKFHEQGNPIFPKPSNGNECLICLNEGMNMVLILRCGCINCESCLDKSFNFRQCVKCGVDLNDDDINMFSAYFA